MEKNRITSKFKRENVLNERQTSLWQKQQQQQQQHPVISNQIEEWGEEFVKMSMSKQKCWTINTRRQNFFSAQFMAYKTFSFVTWISREILKLENQDRMEWMTEERRKFYAKCNFLCKKHLLHLSENHSMDEWENARRTFLSVFFSLWKCFIVNEKIMLSYLLNSQTQWNNKLWVIHLDLETRDR